MSDYLRSTETHIGQIGQAVLTAKSKRDGSQVHVDLFDVVGREVKRPGVEARSIARDYLARGQKLVTLRSGVRITDTQVRYTYQLVAK